MASFCSKSEFAFRCTCASLAAPGHWLYFWTFTFEHVHADWECSRSFTRFLDHIRKLWSGPWGGVKVSELHLEHGVHFHALVDMRLPVDILRRVGARYGLGRVQVRRASAGDVDYLAKYLGKQHVGALCKGGRRQRRWSAFGHVPRTRCSDIVNDSDYWKFRRSRGLGWTDFVHERLLRVVWIKGDDEFLFAHGLAKEDCRLQCRDNEPQLLAMVHGSVSVVRGRAGVLMCVRGPSLSLNPF